MRRIVRTMLCTVMLVAGLCGCEKMVPEIDVANNLEGSWQKVYPEGVQDAGLVIWSFSTTDKESQDPFILTIYVSDVFSGRQPTRPQHGTMSKSAARTNWCSLVKR